MSNPNPKLANLELGRGKRPKLSHTTVAMRMSDETRKRLEELAARHGCTYGTNEEGLPKPWIAGLLAKVGDGELIIVPSLSSQGSQSEADY